uniref:non-specific serine/threonine protein kinase n=1 Tax=Lygus hesperus TaxID=30085 RepID=A0A0A9WU52_LYGHE
MDKNSGKEKATMSGSKMMSKDFVFESQLGTGAFSKVMVGLHKPTNKHYAVKVVSKQTILNIQNEEERARMASVVRREAQMLRLCNHANIVKFYASMQSLQDLYFITELCDGG